MTRTTTVAEVRTWLDTLHGGAGAGPTAEAGAVGGEGRRAGPPDAPPEPPSADGLRHRAELLDLPAPDRDRVLATFPDPERDPELWRALRRCHRTLFAPDVSAAPTAPVPTGADWPDAPAALGDAGRYFYVHLCLLALPAALERQRRLGVPPEVVAATFADVGAKLVTYRKAHRTGGFDRQRWVVRHFRGTLFRLGRLQFERLTLDARALGGAPGPDGPADGDRVLGVHIPADGPFTPERCEESLRAAPGFFARHFPHEPVRHGTCSSWLLDRQLAGHLPPESNIVRFQQRFTPFGARPVGDDDILEFVFHTPPGTADLERLPRSTTLHRAVVDHLRSGHHWRSVHGWLPLPPVTPGG
ncbi:acyltransferase domain-containing protein [Streptomyces sp. NPDC049916]|uniref:acyltransferase domain-containing protein n=1 Tax=Streptomyces sp. NPDC049916 TaxID=3155156 RepID=UPI003430D399